LSSEELIEALRAAPWAGPGPVIRELRRGQGLRLKDLADRAGVSVGYLSRLERGEAGGDNPSLASLEMLARALGVPLSALMPPDEQSAPSDGDLAETLAGREVLLAITFHQPVTLPVIERCCAHAGDTQTIASALEHLIDQGLVRCLPPIAPGRPTFYVLESRMLSPEEIARAPKE
jgi:transcriptional regulator with XRE-family HTH domain